MKILIIDGHEIALQGLARMLEQDATGHELKIKTSLEDVDLSMISQYELILIDYCNVQGALEFLRDLKNKNIAVPILAITDQIHIKTATTALSYGVCSHLLKSCGAEEIKEAIESSLLGKQFFCGQVVEALSMEKEAKANCEGVSLTERELEIIRFIAKGYTNKEIADLLFISAHTVNTHRKNIMAKLNIKNVAGLVGYAFQEDLFLTT